MAEKDAATVLCVVALLGVGVLLYCANEQTKDGRPIPQVQGEAQVMGLGVQAGMRVNAGTPLDLSHHIHGWHPGYDPDPTAQPVMDSPHRYPSIPGGNVSTVIHNGWSRVGSAAPANQGWLETPPEAAIV